jgi:hypothetical protein
MIVQYRIRAKMAPQHKLITSSGAVCQSLNQDAPVAPCHGQSFTTVMDLPSSRELELEALLRNKETQLAELTVRPLLRHFIPS